jgi:hypothetical protein
MEEYLWVSERGEKRAGEDTGQVDPTHAHASVNEDQHMLEYLWVGE